MAGEDCFKGNFSTSSDPPPNRNSRYFELRWAGIHEDLTLRFPNNVWYGLVTGEVTNGDIFIGKIYHERLEQFSGYDVLCKLGVITNVSIQIGFRNETSFILCRRKDTSSSYYIFSLNEQVEQATLHDDFEQNRMENISRVD